MTPGEGYIEVSQTEFRRFLLDYGAPLEYHWSNIFEPPSHGYYDWTKAIGKRGTSEYAASARQAWCIYDQGNGEPPAQFFVRSPVTTGGEG